jgi:mannose-6-phosphate isomerase-like protein (cupin superfamily)
MITTIKMIIRAPTQTPALNIPPITAQLLIENKARIVGELNGQHVKLVKLQGEFVWHKHDEEDELFLVLAGEFTMELRDRTLNLSPGEFIIIPKGMEHRPVAKEEVHLMLFEPAGTLNTGNTEGEFTRHELEQI